MPQTKVEKRIILQPKVSRLVANNKHEIPCSKYIVKLKNLEYADIKSLDESTIALSIVNRYKVERLKNTNLSNKQKKEVELIASMEAFKVIDSLIRSIESSIN